MINLLLAGTIGTTWELPFEIPFIEWLQSLAGSGSFLYYLMNFISMFGEELMLVGILGLLYWGLDKKRGEKIGLFLITATLLTPLVKNIACRTRPFDSHPYVEGEGGVHNFRDVDGYSFPSGHSSGSASVFVGTALAYKDKKKKWLWAVCCIIPVLVALSRNYLGAHYPTDVLAGLAIGVGTVFLMNLLIGVVKNKYFVYGGLLVVGLAGFFYCTTSDFFTGYGIALGFTCALLFEEKVVNFKNTKVWWRIILRVAVGGLLFLGLNELLKMGVGGFHKITVDGEKMYWYMQEKYIWFERIFRTLRYAVIVFLLMGVYPMLFKQTEKLWKKWHWLETDDTVSGKLPKQSQAAADERDGTADVDTAESTDSENAPTANSDASVEQSASPDITVTPETLPATETETTSTVAAEPKKERKKRK